MHAWMRRIGSSQPSLTTSTVSVAQSKPSIHYCRNQWIITPLVLFTIPQGVVENSIDVIPSELLGRLLSRATLHKLRFSTFKGSSCERRCIQTRIGGWTWSSYDAAYPLRHMSVSALHIHASVRQFGSIGTPVPPQGVGVAALKGFNQQLSVINRHYRDTKLPNKPAEALASVNVCMHMYIYCYLQKSLYPFM